jgi:hypothetical protein
MMLKGDYPEKRWEPEEAISYNGKISICRSPMDV